MWPSGSCWPGEAVGLVRGNRPPSGASRADGGAPPSTGRQLYLDNLKVLLIGAIIALHGIGSYAGTIEVWTYTELREVTLISAAEIAVVVLALPFGLFLIALLFLASGLLTVPSMDRKGPTRFARDRLVRLGIPFAVYVLLIQPTVVYALEHPLGYSPGSYWAEYLGEERILDTGPLWFVGVLLIYSLVYAAWVHLRGPRAHRASGAISGRHLAIAAAIVAPASFLIRLVYPYGSDAGFTDLNLWQWPACIAVFALGIAAARQGWASSVPNGVRRTCRTVSVVAIVAMAALLVAAGLQERVEDMMGGPNELAAGFAALDAVLCLFGSVWLLSVAQHHLARPLPHGRALARSAYGAFILQTPILIGLALVLRHLDLPAEVKALLVASGGIVASYALAWLLITRIPGLDRVL
ncbi:MAG: acyltransferase [Candidatus Nanopelagicales bacterium]